MLRLVPSDHDPDDTPFLETLAAVEAVFRALPEPFNVAFAIGAFAGLRTGEVFGLRWPAVDLANRRIVVREQRGARKVKDKEPRVVPILDPLLPVLAAWRERHPGTGLVIPSPRPGGGAVPKKMPGPILRAALERLGLARDGLGWYEATRHTFASQWAMAGGSMPELQKILGHYSIVMTMRYARLAPGSSAKALARSCAPI